MDELEVKRLLKTVYNKKLYIVLILLLFILLGYIYSYYYVTPKYKSETSILLIKNTEDSSESEITQSDINLNQKLVATYGEIIKSNKVLRKVIKNLNLNLTESKLYNLISVTDVNNTEMLKITVVNEDAKLAKEITNEIAEVFSAEVIKLYKIDNVNVIDEAEEAIIPYNINHVKDILIFAVIGTLISIVFVFIMYYFDSTIKEEEDVEAYIGVNLLSTIPMQQKYMKNKKAIEKSNKDQELEELITYEDYKSPISEFFRTLRTNILFTQTNNNMRTLLVTSGMMGEGKSWVTANLATAFAQSEKKVLLIDSDMRKGRQHHIFKVNNKMGFSNCLAMKNEEIINIDNFKNYINETKVENLHIMTSGNRPPNPSELLSSEKVKLIIQTLKNIYDLIIFDGTPCMLVSDSIILSSMIDTTILVAEYRKSKIENTKKLKKSIENAGGIIGGLVLNKLPISAKSYKSKYYYGEKNEEKGNTAIEIKNSNVKTVEELIESSKSDTTDDGLQENLDVTERTIDEKISKLENMVENYFNVNNELIKKNLSEVSKLKLALNDKINGKVIEPEESDNKKKKVAKNTINKNADTSDVKATNKSKKSDEKDLSEKKEKVSKKTSKKLDNEDTLESKTLNKKSVSKKTDSKTSSTGKLAKQKNEVVLIAEKKATKAKEKNVSSKEATKSKEKATSKKETIETKAEPVSSKNVTKKSTKKEEPKKESNTSKAKKKSTIKEPKITIIDRTNKNESDGLKLIVGNKKKKEVPKQDLSMQDYSYSQILRV